MRAWQRAATAIATVSILAASFTTPAAAGDRYWGHHGGHHHHDGGDLVAAGVIGLALGAIIGSALSEPHDRYYDGPRGAYYEPKPLHSSYGPYRSEAYYGPPPAETPEWYDYCAARYDTFDARSGTFIGADRRLHFCQ